MANAVTAPLSCKGKNGGLFEPFTSQIQLFKRTVLGHRNDRGDVLTRVENHRLQPSASGEGNDRGISIKLLQARPNLARARSARFREPHHVARDEPGREERRDEVALEEFARGRHGCELKMPLAIGNFRLDWRLWARSNAARLFRRPLAPLATRDPQMARAEVGETRFDSAGRIYIYIYTGTTDS